MELVPLIYTILKIVAVLAIITLIVSYLSFRNKLKRGILDLPTSAQNQKEESRSIVLPIHNEEHLTQPVVKKVVAKEIPKSQKLSTKESTREKSTSKKTKHGKISHSKRLQIIKELQPDKNKKNTPKEELPPPRKTNESLKSLDEDIISRYEEKDENDFHVLKVKDRKDKHAK